MAKNKKDPALDNVGLDDDMFTDLDFEDSDLASFSIDGDEFDADEDRKPVGKLQKFTKELNYVGQSAMAGAAGGIAEKVRKSLPEVGSMASEAMTIMSDAQRLRNDVVQNARPVLNQTKIITRQLTKYAEDVIPTKVYNKLMDALGPEEDKREEKLSKEEERQAALAREMASIFKLQTKQKIYEKKQEAVQRIMDERIASSRYQESTGIMSDIRNQMFFQTSFLKKTFTAYIKKDLELKYRSLFLQEDTLETLRITAQMQEERLDAINHNTALPDSQKIQLLEVASKQLKEQALSMLTQGGQNVLSKYMGGIFKNIQKEYIEPGLEMVGTFNDSIESFMEMLQLEDEMGGGGGARKSLMGMLGGAVGGIFGHKMGRGILEKIPKDVRDQLTSMSKMGSQGLALYLDQARRGELDSSIIGKLEGILDVLAPKLEREKFEVTNKSFTDPNGVAPITNRFTKTVEEIIPGYLSKQLQMLELLATGKMREEQHWSFKQNDFVGISTIQKEITTAYVGTRESRMARMQGHVDMLRKEAGKENNKLAAVSIEENAKDLSIVIQNLIEAKRWWSYNGETSMGIVPELIQELALAPDVPEGPDDNRTLVKDLIKSNEFLRIAFSGIKNPKQVAKAMCTQLFLPSQDPNKVYGPRNQTFYQIYNERITREIHNQAQINLDNVLNDFGYARFAKHLGKVNEYGAFVADDDIRRSLHHDVTDYDVAASTVYSDYDASGKRIKEKTGLEKALDSMKDFDFKEKIRGFFNTVDELFAACFEKVGAGAVYDKIKEVVKWPFEKIAAFCDATKQTFRDLSDKSRKFVLQAVANLAKDSEWELLKDVVATFMEEDGSPRKNIPAHELAKLADKLPGARAFLKRVYAEENQNKMKYWFVRSMLVDCPALQYLGLMSDDEYTDFLNTTKDYPGIRESILKGNLEKFRELESLRGKGSVDNVLMDNQALMAMQDLLDGKKAEEEPEVDKDGKPKKLSKRQEELRAKQAAEDAEVRAYLQSQINSKATFGDRSKYATGTDVTEPGFNKLVSWLNRQLGTDIKGYSDKELKAMAKQQLDQMKQLETAKADAEKINRQRIALMEKYREEVNRKLEVGTVAEEASRAYEESQKVGFISLIDKAINKVTAVVEIETQLKKLEARTKAADFDSMVKLTNQIEASMMALKPDIDEIDSLMASQDPPIRVPKGNLYGSKEAFTTCWDDSHNPSKILGRLIALRKYLVSYWKRKITSAQNTVFKYETDETKTNKKGVTKFINPLKQLEADIEKLTAEADKAEEKYKSLGLRYGIKTTDVRKVFDNANEQSVDFFLRKGMDREEKKAAKEFGQMTAAELQEYYKDLSEQEFAERLKNKSPEGLPVEQDFLKSGNVAENQLSELKAIRSVIEAFRGDVAYFFQAQGVNVPGASGSGSRLVSATGAPIRFAEGGFLSKLKNWGKSTFGFGGKSSGGGFVDEPTLIDGGQSLVGEHGPELVIPLNNNKKSLLTYLQAKMFFEGKDGPGVALNKIRNAGNWMSANPLMHPFDTFMNWYQNEYMPSWGSNADVIAAANTQYLPTEIEKRDFHSHLAGKKRGWLHPITGMRHAMADMRKGMYESKALHPFRTMKLAANEQLNHISDFSSLVKNDFRMFGKFFTDNPLFHPFATYRDRKPKAYAGGKDLGDQELTPEQKSQLLVALGMGNTHFQDLYKKFTDKDGYIDQAKAKYNETKTIVDGKLDVTKTWIDEKKKSAKTSLSKLWSTLKGISDKSKLTTFFKKLQAFFTLIAASKTSLEEEMDEADRRVVKELRLVFVGKKSPADIDSGALMGCNESLRDFVLTAQQIADKHKGKIDAVRDTLNKIKDNEFIKGTLDKGKDLTEKGKGAVLKGYEKVKGWGGAILGAIKNWLTNESGTLIDIQTRALDALIAIHGVLSDGLVVAGYKTSVQGGQHDIEHTKTFGETVKGWGRKAWDKTKSGVKAVVWDAPMWGVKTVGRAGRDFATNRYCDVYRRPAANQKLGPDLLLIPEEMFKQGVFFDKEGKERVKSVADITQPVYDGNGDPLISAGDIKQGLVDEDEVSITTFGSRAGRIGRSIATAPLRAAHWAGKKIWEKIPGFSAVRKAVSIATAPLAFIKASFSRWVDIYKKDHVKADEVLVTAKDLEAGLLEFYDGTEIKDAHKINKPVIWKNMPANGSRAGNVAISTDDIKDGLVTKNNEPLDRFANKLGGVVNLLARGVGKVAGMVGGGMGAVISGAWSITKKAWDFLSKKKDPYIDVYEKDKIEPGKPLITGKGIREGKYYFADGTQVKSAYGITQAVLDDDGKTCIDEDQIKTGLVDINGGSLSKWSGRSLIGKVATGLPTVAWHAAKFIGKTAWKGVKAVGRVLGRVLGITSEAADNVAYGIGSFFNGIFGSDRVRRKDLETIVGERLQKIYDLLAMKFGGGVSGDADGDGDRDGSYKDQQEKKKEREAKRRAKTEEFRKKQEAEHMKKLGIAQAPSGESSSSIFGELAEIFGVSAAMDWWKNKKEKAKQKIRDGAATTRGKIATGLSKAGSAIGGALKGGATALGGALFDMLPGLGGNDPSGRSLRDRYEMAKLRAWYRGQELYGQGADKLKGKLGALSDMLPGMGDGALRDRFERARLRSWYQTQDLYGQGVDKLKAMRSGGKGKLGALLERIPGLGTDPSGRTLHDRMDMAKLRGWYKAQELYGQGADKLKALGGTAGNIASKYGGMAGNALRTAGGFIAPKLAGMAAGASGLLGTAGSAIAGAAATAGGALASGLGTAMGAAAGLLTNPVGWAILAAGAAYGGYKLLSWMFSDSKNEKEWKAVRYRAYGTSKKNEDMLEDLEKETLKIIFRQRGELSKEEIEGFAKQCGLVNGGYIFGLIGGDNDKTKDEKTEYFTTWYTKRFRPIFEAYAKIVANATGKYDSIDVDAIPAEKYKECITSFKGEVSRITDDKLVKDLVPNVAGYTKYQRAKKLEEASKLREGGKEGDVNGIIGKMKQAQLDREHEKRVKDDVKAGGAVGALASMELERIQERRKANRKGLKGFLLNAKDFALKWGKMLLGISALEWLGEAFGIIDTKENKLWKQARYDYYGIDVKLQADAMDDFEKEMLPVVDGDEDPPEDVSEWMDRFGLNGIVTRNVANKAGGYFFDPRTHLARAIQGVGKLAGGIASMFNTKEDDEKEDLKKEYFERWMYGRFFPIYDAYVTTVRELTGTEPGDKVNVDKIKKRDQRKALGQFTETAKGIIDNDPEMKNILPTPEGFEKWYKDQKAKADAKKAKDEEATKNELAGITGAGGVALSDEELQKKKDNHEQLSATEEARLSLNQRLQDQKAREGETAIGGFFREADGMLNDAGRFLARWTLALPYRMLGFDVAQSQETYEWRAVRAEYYGLKEKDLNSAMRDFEEDVLEIVDGEEPEMDEDTLRKYYRMIMLGDYNSSIARGIMNVGRAIGSLFTSDEEDDLEDERFAYFCTWYAKRFRPLYELYVNTVRAVTEGEPGDEPDVDDIPEELYVKTLSTFMRSADNFLGKDPNTKKLIPTIEGFEAYLEEKEAAQAKQQMGETPPPSVDVMAGAILDKEEEKKKEEYEAARLGQQATHEAMKQAKKDNEESQASIADRILSGLTELANSEIFTNPGAALANVGWKIVDWLFGDSENVQNWKRIKYEGYGVDPKKHRSAINDLEDDVLDIIDGKKAEFTEDELKDIAEDFGLIDQGSFFKLLGGDSEEVIRERMNYFSTWYATRFRPIFESYVKIIRAATGYEASFWTSATPDPDGIQDNMQQKVLEQFKKQVDAIVGRGEVKKFGPDLESFEKYKQAKKEEEARQRAAATADGNQAAASALAEKKAEEKEAADRAKANEAQREANEQAKKQAEAAANSSSAGGSGTNGADPNNSGGATDVINKAANATFETSSSAGSGGAAGGGGGSDGSTGDSTPSEAGKTVTKLNLKGLGDIKPMDENVLAAQFANMKLTRGKRNNNPGNVIVTSWTRKRPGFIDGDRVKGGKGAAPYGKGNTGMARFSAPEFGIATALTLTKDTYGKQGLDTIRKITHKYSPPHENNTAQLIRQYSKASGFKPDEKINWENQEAIKRYMAEKFRMESSIKFPDDVMNRAFALVYGGSEGATGETQDGSMNPGNGTASSSDSNTGGSAAQGASGDAGSSTGAGNATGGGDAGGSTGGGGGSSAGGAGASAGGGAASSGDANQRAEAAQQQANQAAGQATDNQGAAGAQAGGGAKGNIVRPTNSNVITSPFGPRNVPGGSKNHKGVDLRARQGQPIFATHAGKVAVSSPNYGTIGIEHPDGIATEYMHLSKRQVKAGDQVTTGQQIGLAGGVGAGGKPNAYTPHLHFGVAKGKFAWNKSNWIDPEPWFKKNQISTSRKGQPGNNDMAPLSDAQADGKTGNEQSAEALGQEIAKKDPSAMAPENTKGTTPEANANAQMSQTIKDNPPAGNSGDSAASASASAATANAGSAAGGGTDTGVAVASDTPSQTGSVGSNGGDTELAELKLMRGVLEGIREDMRGYFGNGSSSGGSGGGDSSSGGGSSDNKTTEVKKEEKKDDAQQAKLKDAFNKYSGQDEQQKKLGNLFETMKNQGAQKDLGNAFNKYSDMGKQQNLGALFNKHKDPVNSAKVAPQQYA